jgi:hypothetical protein
MEFDLKELEILGESLIEYWDLHLPKKGRRRSKETIKKCELIDKVLNKVHKELIEKRLIVPFKTNKN